MRRESRTLYAGIRSGEFTPALGHAAVAALRVELKTLEVEHRIRLESARRFTPEEAATFYRAMGAVVRRHVKDQTVRHAIVEDMREEVWRYDPDNEVID